MASFAPTGRQGRPPRAQHHNTHPRGQPQMQPQAMPMQAHMPPYIYMTTNMPQFPNQQAYIQGYTTPQFIYQQNANPTAMGQQPGASAYYTQQMQMATMSSQVPSNQISQPQPGRPPSAPGISSTPATPHPVMSQSVGPTGVSQYTPGTQQQHPQPQLPTPSQGYPLQQPPPHQPAQQQMNTQAGQPAPPRYTQPPMQPLRMPPQQQVPMPQQPLPKRARKPLLIVNPDTHDIVNKDDVDASSDPAAPSDPVPARESLPKEEVKPESAANAAVKNQFKALVTSRLQGDEPAENTAAVPAVNGDVEPTSATIQSAVGPQDENDQVNLVSSTSSDKAASLDSQPAAQEQCAVISSSNKETESAADITTPADAVDSPRAAEQVPADVTVTPADTAAPALEAVSVTDQVPECAAEDETQSSVEVSALPDTTGEITKSSVVVERITPTPVAPLSAPVTPGDEETEAVGGQETVGQQEAEADNKHKVEIVEEPKTEVKPDAPSVKETESKVTVIPISTPEAVPTDTQLMPPPATPPLESVEPAAPSSPAPPTEPKTVTLAPSPLKAPGKLNSLNTGMKGSKSVAADMSKLSAESKSFRADDQDMSKKVYNRDFLISLQFIDLSKQKPKDLPNFAEIVMSEPNSSSRDFKSIRHVKDFDFNPHYFKPSGSPRPSSSKQQRGSMSRESRAPPKSIDYKREGAKLKRSENAWKKAEKTEKTDDEVKSAEQKKEEMLKKFRGQLNKITPQNFQSLSEKILALGIETESELDGVMRLVFEKAIAEPGFSVTYAQLCHRLSKEFKVTADSDPTNEVTFRKLLLVRCQKEFERSNDDDEELVVKSKALKEAASDKKSQLQEEYDSFLSKARRRKLGNIRFIGELYKLQMLTGKIMHDCIVSLLKSTDEEGYECLCKLLRTIGKFLDQPKAQNLMNQYFAKMKELSQNPKKASSRIRFALKDVIELRENNWKPRRDENNPKTIAEVHAEAALEAHETQAMLEKSHITGRGSQSRNPPPSRNNRRDEDSGGSGWSTVPVMKTQRIDPTKLRLSKQSETIQLGPSRGLSGSWSRGSAGSGKNTPPQQQEERPNTPTNRFSALRDGSSEFKEERSSSAQRMPPAGRGRGMPRAGSARMGSTPRGSMEKERSNAVAAVRQISRSSGSRGPSRENSVEGRRNVPPSAKPDSSRRPSDVPGKVPVAVKQLSRDEWETKMKGIVEEFLNNRDVKEMMECIKELDAQSNKNLITECSINHVLEKSDSARKAVGNMLAELIKHELLPLDLHLKGVAAVLEFAEDLAIDIPNVWKYLGQLIAPMFTVASIPLSKLEPVCTPLLDIGKSATLAAEILKEASHNSNPPDVGKRWSDSGLTWSTFLSSGEDLDEFIKSNKLEYTLGDSPATSSSSPVSQDLFSIIGPLLLNSETKSNDQIFDKINASIPEALREEQSFIKSLTTCVAKSCIENGKFVEGIFKNRSAVLTKYLDNRVEREESALIALEELMDELEHPAGLLSDFCYAFSDDDLVSDESFFSWEKNSKSGIAVKSVSAFFKWLREDNDNTQ